MKKDNTLPTAPVTGVLEEAFADVQQSFESFCLAAGMAMRASRTSRTSHALCAPIASTFTAAASPGGSASDNIPGVSDGLPCW